jgi:hypothetical protein
LSKVNLDFFKDMEKEDLLKYLEFLLWHYRVVDSFWFLQVEEAHGRETAEKLNEEVWARVGPMSIRDLKTYFNIREKGLEGLEKALRLLPWTNIGGHQIRKTDNQIILTVPRCPPQVARLKRGLGEYDCKDMHKREFINAVKEIDPRIRVECDFAPPDPHPEDLFCKWRFTI